MGRLGLGNVTMTVRVRVRVGRAVLRRNDLIVHPPLQFFRSCPLSNGISNRQKGFRLLPSFDLCKKVIPPRMIIESQNVKKKTGTCKVVNRGAVGINVNRCLVPRATLTLSRS